MLERNRKGILQTAKRMVADRLISRSAVNVNTLDRESGSIVITPSAIDYSNMSEDDLVVLDS